MYVCMSVRNGFTTEVYEFTYSVCTLRHVPVLVRLSSRRAHDTMEDLEERRRRQARERVQRYRRRLNDERRQYDSERRRLARKQQSELLRSLTACERDRQRTARHRSRQTTQQR